MFEILPVYKFSKYFVDAIPGIPHLIGGVIATNFVQLLSVIAFV
jgi:hypothetical protein